MLALLTVGGSEDSYSKSIAENSLRIRSYGHIGAENDFIGRPDVKRLPLQATKSLNLIEENYE